MKNTTWTKSLSCVVALLMPCGFTQSQTIGELLAQGDVCDTSFDPAEALKFYLPAAKQDPNNVDLLLRIARQYRHLAADTDSVQQKLKLGETGLEYAKRAEALAPNEPEACLSVAISHVKMVPMLDSKEKMEASKEIKVSVDKALALDPHKDLAWHILGCWHQRLAGVGVMKRTLAVLVYGGLPTASNEDAIACFQKAIKLNSNRLINYIELGRTYAQMGKVAEAKTFISKGLAMPNAGKDDPDAKQRGRETLASIQ